MDEKDSLKHHYMRNEISGFFCIKYIDENAFGLKRKKFFSRLQHRLPKPDATVRYQNGDHPDRRPLLQTPTPTAVNTANTAFEYPPGGNVEVANDVTLVNNDALPENVKEEARLHVMERQISRSFQPNIENETPDPDTQMFNVSEVSETEECPNPEDNVFSVNQTGLCKADVHNHNDGDETVCVETANTEHAQVNTVNTGHTMSIPIENPDRNTGRSRQPLNSSSFESGYQSDSRLQSFGSPTSTGSGSEGVSN